MKIKVSKIATNYNEEGDIESVDVTFQKFTHDMEFNVRINLTQADAGGSVLFEDMTPKNFEKLARKKISEAILDESATVPVTEQ